ncbi:MAG TPA: 30S ribosome-binding factor RbfA [Gammaproteobacteria bacterium]|nr:30S ribosome-binding factor RbfA [Gammaproteobacteria bacterium]
MSARTQRVADQIRREIAVLIQMELNDPRIGMVSVTAVKVSRDLSYAKIYVTVLNSLADSGAVNSSTLSAPGQLDKLEIEENLEALNRASGYLRSLLAKRLTLRSVPKLRFHYDGSVERGRHLSELIDNALAADRDLHS